MFWQYCAGRSCAALNAACFSALMRNICVASMRNVSLCAVPHRSAYVTSYLALHIIANKHLDDILCCKLMRCTDWLTAARRAVYLRNLLHDSLCTVLHATVAYSIACGSIACCLCCCFCLVHLAPITDVRARAQSSRNARSSFRCGSIARNRGRRCDIGNM